MRCRNSLDYPARLRCGRERQSGGKGSVVIIIGLHCHCCPWFPPRHQCEVSEFATSTSLFMVYSIRSSSYSNGDPVWR